MEIKIGKDKYRATQLERCVLDLAQKHGLQVEIVALPNVPPDYEVQLCEQGKEWGCSWSGAGPSMFKALADAVAMWVADLVDSHD